MNNRTTPKAAPAPAAGITNPANHISKGSGAPVILIHGLAASLFDWNDLIPELTQAGYAAYALDLLGHGQSLKPEQLNDYNADNVYAHFSAWIDSLNLFEPLVLVGHSLGGYIAIQYALQYPQRVRALVLTDPLYNLEQLPFLLRLNYRRPLVNAAMIERAPEWLFRRIIDITSLSIRNGFALSEEVRIQTAADYKRAHPGIFDIIHTIQDLTPQLASVSQPTLVLWGERDQTLAPTSFPRVLKEIPRSSGCAIPGAGHVPHQSHPAEYNSRVMEFLASLP